MSFTSCVKLSRILARSFFDLQYILKGFTIMHPVRCCIGSRNRCLLHPGFASTLHKDFLPIAIDHIRRNVICLTSFIPGGSFSNTSKVIVKVRDYRAPAKQWNGSVVDPGSYSDILNSMTSTGAHSSQVASSRVTTISYFSTTSSFLKSTLPSRAGTRSRAQARRCSKLKSTLPSRAGTAKRRSAVSSVRCLNPPCPRGQGLFNLTAIIDVDTLKSTLPSRAGTETCRSNGSSCRLKSTLPSRAGTGFV